MRHKIIVNCEKVRRKKEGAVAYLEILSCISLQVDHNVRDKVFLSHAMKVYARMKQRSTHSYRRQCLYGNGWSASRSGLFDLGKRFCQWGAPEPVWTLRREEDSGTLLKRDIKHKFQLTLPKIRTRI
jgi:hypothetical protein